MVIIYISIVVVLEPVHQGLILSLHCTSGTVSITPMKTTWSMMMTSTPRQTDMVTHHITSPAHHIMIVTVTMTDDDANSI